jgi:hypothetical protein
MSITFSTARPAQRRGFSVCCYGYGSDAEWQGPIHATPEAALAEHERTHLGNEDCDAKGPSAPVYARYDTDDDPSVNMSNTNASHLLNVLGFPEADSCGRVSSEDFLGRVLVALAVSPHDAGLPALTTSTGGATFVECGRSEGYTQHRLDQLRTLAEFARGYDADITWG